MNHIIENLNIYIIPPLLSFILGWSLAIVSVLKGKFRTENILFSLVCIFWTLMPLIFIAHQFLRGDTDSILHVEKSVHFLYVYMPAVVFLYLHKSFGLGNKFFLILSFTASSVISLFVHTDLYISGLYTYSWGYCAKGDILFTIFGADAAIHLLYTIYFFIRKIKITSNKTIILKLKYIVLSFIAASFFPQLLHFSLLILE